MESLDSQPCATGSFYESRNFTGLPDGAHVVRVQARSAGGTYGPVLTRTFTVVSGAVTGMSVVSGPGEGSTIPSSWAAFSWSAPAAQCYRHELDGSVESLDSQPCANGSFYQSWTFTSCLTAHVLRVQARSAGGTYGPVLTRTFTVVSGAVTGMSVVSGPGEGSDDPVVVGGVLVGGAGGAVLSPRVGWLGGEPGLPAVCERVVLRVADLHQLG